MIKSIAKSVQNYKNICSIVSKDNQLLHQNPQDIDNKDALNSLRLNVIRLRKLANLCAKLRVKHRWRYYSKEKHNSGHTKAIKYANNVENAAKDVLQNIAIRYEQLQTPSQIQSRIQPKISSQIQSRIKSQTLMTKLSNNSKLSSAKTSRKSNHTLKSTAKTIEQPSNNFNTNDLEQYVSILQEEIKTLEMQLNTAHDELKADIMSYFQTSLYFTKSEESQYFYNLSIIQIHLDNKLREFGLYAFFPSLPAIAAFIIKRYCGYTKENLNNHVDEIMNKIDLLKKRDLVDVLVMVSKRVFVTNVKFASSTSSDFQNIMDFEFFSITCFDKTYEVCSYGDFSLKDILLIVDENIYEYKPLQRQRQRQTYTGFIKLMDENYVKKKVSSLAQDYDENINFVPCDTVPKSYTKQKTAWEMAKITVKKLFLTKFGFTVFDKERLYELDRCVTIFKLIVDKYGLDRSTSFKDYLGKYIENILPIKISLVSENTLRKLFINLSDINVMNAILDAYYNKVPYDKLHHIIIDIVKDDDIGKLTPLKERSAKSKK
jgi:hypothetical protein